MPFLNEDLSEEPGATHVSVYKALRTFQQQRIPSLILHVEEPWPDESRPHAPAPILSAALATHKEQAARIVTALMNSLPQGTMHELIFLLMHHYSCLYLGPCDGHGPIRNLSDQERGDVPAV